MTARGRRFVVTESGLPGCLTALVIAAVTPLALAAQAFEGTVTMRELSIESGLLGTALVERVDDLSRLSLAGLAAMADSAGVPVTRTEIMYYVSGSRLRSAAADDSPGMAEFLIADFAEGIYRVVDPAQGLIVEWRGRAAEDTVAPDDAIPAGEPDVAALDHTREVNGFRCRGWVLRYGAAIVEISWLTNALDDLTGTFRSLALLSEQLGSGGESGQSVRRLLDKGFPVLTLTADAELGVVSAAEIVAVERRALPAGTFDPPRDYLTVTVER